MQFYKPFLFFFVFVVCFLLYSYQFSVQLQLIIYIYLYKYACTPLVIHITYFLLFNRQVDLVLVVVFCLFCFLFSSSSDNNVRKHFCLALFVVLWS